MALAGLSSLFDLPLWTDGDALHAMAPFPDVCDLLGAESPSDTSSNGFFLDAHILTAYETSLRASSPPSGLTEPEVEDGLVPAGLEAQEPGSLNETHAHPPALRAVAPRALSPATCGAGCSQCVPDPAARRAAPSAVWTTRLTERLLACFLVCPALTPRVSPPPRCCPAPPLEEEHLYVLVGDPGKVRSATPGESESGWEWRLLARDSPYRAPLRITWLPHPQHWAQPHRSTPHPWQHTAAGQGRGLPGPRLRRPGTVPHSDPTQPLHGSHVLPAYGSGSCDGMSLPIHL